MPHMTIGPLAELLERADEIASLSIDGGSGSERSGRLAEDVVGAIRASGLSGMALPVSLGGFASPPVATTEVLERIASSDAASAWIVLIASTTSLNAAFLPRSGAAEVFSNGPHSLNSGVLAPRGSGSPVPGGHRVSGRWPFCSGCLHADWIGVGFHVEEVEEIRMGFVPAGAVEIIDSWNVLGLSATGSHDIRLDEVFIPESHSWSVTNPTCWSDEPLFSFPIYGMLAMGVAAVMSGVAHGAISDVLALATAKTPTGSRRTLAQRPMVQDAVARSTAQLEAGRAYMRFEGERAWERAGLDGAMDPMTRTRLRMAATHMADAATAVVERMFRVAGGTAIYRTSRLEQRMRDVNTAAQHMMVAQPTWEMAGKVLLGVGEHDQL